MVRADKWKGLVQAASRLFHQQGFEHTSLADIAEAAEVPVGNVYYYFKTRDELLKAVVQERLAASRAKREELESIPDPKERLLAFVGGFEARTDESTAYGCPMGGLCQETNKQGGLAAEEAAVPLRDLFEWLTRQFRSLGFKEPQARDHAARIVAARQGSILLSNTFKDPQYIRLETARLKEWLGGLPAGKDRKKT